MALLFNGISNYLKFEMMRERAVSHEVVIKRKRFPCYWPFVRGIRQSPLDSLHKGQWRGHIIEAPSMVDHQWNILYWGSKWIFHTVSWGAVACEWGTTSVYFEITYVCFIPSRPPVLSSLWGLSTNIYFFYFCPNYHLNAHTKSLKNH